MEEPTKIEGIKTLIDEAKLDEAKEIISSLTVADFSEKANIKILRDIFVNIDSVEIKELIKEKIDSITNNKAESQEEEEKWADDDEIQLIMSARNGSLQDVQHYISKGTNVNAKNKYGNNSLIFAVRSGHIEVARELLKSPNIDINCVGESNYTPLHWSINKGLNEIIMILLDKKCNVNIAGNANELPLHLAAKKQDVSVILLLLKQGAGRGINIKNHDGQTPLDIALEKNFPKVAAILSIVKNLSFSVLYNCNVKNLDHEVVITRISALLDGKLNDEQYAQMLTCYYILDRLKKSGNCAQSISDKIGEVLSKADAKYTRTGNDAYITRSSEFSKILFTEDHLAIL